MRRFLLLISILSITLFAAPAAHAQNTFPAKEGEKVRYSVQIDFGKAYLSGIGIMAYVDGEVLGSVFNEFGMSALSFSYNPQSSAQRDAFTKGLYARLKERQRGYRSVICNSFSSHSTLTYFCLGG